MSIKNLTDAQLQSELKLLPKTSLCREFVLQEMGSRVAEVCRDRATKARQQTLTYKSALASGAVLAVRLDGRTVGHIKQGKSSGFYYKPLGSGAGEILGSIEAVKQSLEAK